jgi:guanylate kinase
MEQGIKVGAARPVPRTITTGHRHTHDDHYQTYDHSIDQEAMLIEKRSLPLAISGPIGSGKGALARAVLDDPQLGSLFAQPIRHTSRRPREGELHSVDFYFVSKTEFEQLIAEDAFAEWSLGDKASLVGAANQYTGTTTVSIARTTQKGLVPLLQLDMSAFLSIVANQATMDVRAVFLTSDKISLAQRINKR